MSMRYRSGAENSMRMDQMRDEAYVENLKQAVRRAIEPKDGSGLKAALEAEVVWTGYGGHQVVEAERETDKSEL
jgi:hypothetical protein